MDNRTTFMRHFSPYSIHFNRKQDPIILILLIHQSLYAGSTDGAPIGTKLLLRGQHHLEVKSRLR